MIESGSFRDPTARVFYSGRRVLRGLSPDAAAVDEEARSSGLMEALVDRALFVDNRLVDDVEPPPGVPDAAIVESERIPVVSYPSEWSFSMLKDAALATLDANLVALEHGFILKDASGFNVAFDGTRPRILDVASLEPFGEKGIWTAYAQFCDHFLAPLLLEAHAGVAFQPVLAARTEGLGISDLGRLLRGRAGLRRGVFGHVRLRAAIERRAARMGTATRADVGRAELPKDAVTASIRKMRALVTRLESGATSTWSDYEAALPYSADGVDAKEAFVRAAAESATGGGVALDIGANAGRFTRILTEHFEHVIAVDNDPGAVDVLYRAARDGDWEGVTPMVVDITNPTPSHGWRGRERKAFLERVRPVFSTWLAVLHHLCLGTGIPLDEVVGLVYEVSDSAVVEFVDPGDPMARHISATRRSSLAPYTRERFEECATAEGTLLASAPAGEFRTLYHLTRR